MLLASLHDGGQDTGRVSGNSSPTTDSEGLVLEGATLIDGTGTAPIASSVIITHGHKILKVGRIGDWDHPDDFTVIDLRGSYILPGFIDMHAHPPPDPNVIPATLRTLLSFGITTIRNPAARPGTGVELRSKVERGEIIGPRVFTAGPLIGSPPPDGGSPDWSYVRTEAEIRSEVRRQKATGVDYIKLYYDLTPDLVAAAIDEAHRVGVRVIGHLGSTSWTEAARAGIDGLVHSGPEVGLLEPLQRRELLPFATGEYLRRWRKTVNLNGPEMDSLATLLTDGNVEVNPTFVLTEVMWWGDDAKTLRQMEPSLAPERDVPGWWGEDWHDSHPYTRHWTKEEFSEARATYPFVLEFFRILHERGVLFTVGTDVGNPWLTPGVSFHRELELMRRAGISSISALSAATRNAAEALGAIDDLGTIEEGKLADLVVLGANPLEDIGNTRRINTVVKRGHCFDPESLLPT